MFDAGLRLLLCTTLCFLFVESASGKGATVKDGSQKLPVKVYNLQILSRDHQFVVGPSRFLAHNTSTGTATAIAVPWPGFVAKLGGAQLERFLEILQLTPFLAARYRELNTAGKYIASGESSDSLVDRPDILVSSGTLMFVPRLSAFGVAHELGHGASPVDPKNIVKSREKSEGRATYYEVKVAEDLTNAGISFPADPEFARYQEAVRRLEAVGAHQSVIDQELYRLRSEDRRNQPREGVLDAVLMGAPSH